MDEIATACLKNYQVWHHRRLLLTYIYSKSPTTKSSDLLLKELKFIEKVFEEDSKNYHTWSYRQWILSNFNRDELWAVEIPFIERMIDEDVRNNSAWHHRFFVVFDSGVRQGDENREDVIRREIVFVLYPCHTGFIADESTSGTLRGRSLLHRTTSHHGII
jgi:protein farnesyltransferase/geranylgeranyltransferase type-1 subunit alpha